jgi:hypothetical protein
LPFFERATVVVVAVLLVATLIRCLENDLKRVAASNAMWGAHFLSSVRVPNLATHTQ